MPKETTALYTIQQDTDKATEDQSMKAWFLKKLRERFPFEDQYGNCQRPDEAYLLYLEQTYASKPPRNLRFEESGQLEQSIDPRHRERISNIYQFLAKKWDEYYNSAVVLDDHWRHAPVDYVDDTAELIIDKHAERIQDEQRAAIKAVISTNLEIKEWQVCEKNDRGAFEKNQKTYLMTLRFYYKMLLEQSPDGTQSVLSADNEELRQEIKKCIELLELLESLYACMGIAKQANFQQKSRRTRETEEEVPSLIHPMEVTGSTIIDVVPHKINEGVDITNIFLEAVVIPASHDLGEDTLLREDDIINSLVKALNGNYDAIRPYMESGFGRERAEIEENLNLLKENDVQTLRECIRILSDNYILNPDEKKFGILANVAGTELTKKLLGVTDKELAEWGIKDSTIEEDSSQTFKVTGEIRKQEEKMARFLVRMSAIKASPKSKMLALETKCEDQAHNLSQMNGWDAGKKLVVLRRNMLLVRWAMLDHNNGGYPLLNTLPRLIKTMLIEYKKLKDWSCFSGEDGVSITELRRYERELEERNKIHKLSREIQGIVDEQYAKHRDFIAPLYVTDGIFAPQEQTGKAA